MSVRYERMNEEIKKTISEIIKEMKDPRICEMTTIMSVDVTNDLKQAKVMVSVYDKDDQLRKDTVEELGQAVDKPAKGHDDTETCVGDAVLLIEKRNGEGEILPYEIEHGIAYHRAYDDTPLPVFESFFCLHHSVF